MPAVVEISEPTLSMGYLLALFEAMEVSPEHLRRLFQQAGVAPGLAAQSTARLTPAQFAQIYRTLALEWDDEMPRLFARPMRVGSLKVTGISLLDAKNLLGALYRWGVVLRLLQDEFDLDVRVGPEHSHIVLARASRAAPGIPFKPQAQDLTLKLLHGLSSWLVMRRLPLNRVDFAFPAPPFAAEYQTLYPGPVRFDQAESALQIDTAYLHLPVRRTRQELVQFVHRAPQDWIFATFKEALLSQRLRDYLAAQLPVSAGVDDAARALHMSTRTLHRRLNDEGSSFQKVKDALRRDMAVQMLTRSRSPIAAISADLGFDSAASFHRAFRLWTGDTPSAYRASAQGKAAMRGLREAA